MLKLYKFIILFICFFTPVAFAGLIPDSLDDSQEPVYVTYGGYDWTWASAYNVQFSGENCVADTDLLEDGKDTPNQRLVEDDTPCNQLLGASYHGWSYYEDFNFTKTLEESLIDIYNERLGDIFGVYSASHKLMYAFMDEYQDLIHSFSYWNTGTVALNEDAKNRFGSNWLDNVDNFGGPHNNSENYFMSTVYVRLSSDGSVPVPEPSTLLIFSLSLIALVSRKKLKR